MTLLQNHRGLHCDFFLLECVSHCICSHHWHLECHRVCLQVWPKQKGYLHHRLDLPPGWTSRCDLCTCTELHFQNVPTLGLMFCCHLEIINNIFFELVFCKWSPVGQRKVCRSSRDKPGLGGRADSSQAPRNCHMCIPPGGPGSLRAPRWAGRDQSPGWWQQL